MPHYDSCPKDVYDLAKTVLQSFPRHTPFLEAGVTYTILFAYSNKNEPCITVHGMPARGRAKIVNLLDRVKGNSDCEVLIDGKWWTTSSTRQRSALLDHELNHFMVKTDKRDDAGRPVLEIRKHDHQFGWFSCVAQAWGSDSSEVEQARYIMAQDGQFYWPEIQTPAQRFDS